MTSFIRRLRIIDMIKQREYTAKELAMNVFEEGEKSSPARIIQKDLEEIAAHYGERFREVKKEKSPYYSILSTSSLWSDIDTDNAEDITKFYEFLILFDADALSLFEKDRPVLIEKLKNEIKQVYHFINQPYEYLPDINTTFLKDIKHAIQFRKYVSIGYQKEDLIAYNNARPLKIVFAHNNWYVAALIHKNDNKGYKFTYLRISLIVSVNVSSTQYSNTDEVKKSLQHLTNPQSLFSLVDREPYKVTLLVQRSIAHYFKSKKYLDSQNIVDNSDGSIIVTYEVNTDEEILPIIKKWLPDIYVLKPKRLQTNVSKMLHRYLNRVEKLHTKES